MISRRCWRSYRGRPDLAPSANGIWRLALTGCLQAPQHVRRVSRRTRFGRRDACERCQLRFRGKAAQPFCLFEESARLLPTEIAQIHLFYGLPSVGSRAFFEHEVS
jgi:hypothetical protein